MGVCARTVLEAASVAAFRAFAPMGATWATLVQGDCGAANATCGGEAALGKGRRRLRGKG